MKKNKIIIIITTMAILALACILPMNQETTKTAQVAVPKQDVNYISPYRNVPSTGYTDIDAHPITVHHEATGHYETRVTKDAYDEKVQTGTRTVVDKEAWDEVVTYYVCSKCGATK